MFIQITVEDELNAYTVFETLNSRGVELTSTDLLKNFSLKPVVLENHHPAIGKTIRDSKIREQISGLVVGMERDGKRILNPKSTDILLKGDLLWVVGDSESLSRL